MQESEVGLAKWTERWNWERQPLKLNEWKFDLDGNDNTFPSHVRHACCADELIHEFGEEFSLTVGVRGEGATSQREPPRYAPRRR
jgi:hypothetical protein